MRDEAEVFVCIHEGQCERDGGGGLGRAETVGWTVQYAPNKGQRDVLFMIQAAAEAAAGPRLK